MFQFPWWPPPAPWIRAGGARPSPRGFSHSGAPGSTGVCPYPGIIAACRALRRPTVPRHPPRALDIFRPLGPALRPWPGTGPGRVSHTSRGRGPPGRSLDALTYHLNMVADWMHKIHLILSYENRSDLSGRTFRCPLIRLAMRLSRCAGLTPGTGRRGEAGGHLDGNRGHRPVISISLSFLGSRISLERR